MSGSALTRSTGNPRGFVSQPGSTLVRSTGNPKGFVSQQEAHIRRPISDKPRHRRHTIKYGKVKHLPAIPEEKEEGGRRHRRAGRKTRRTGRKRA